MDRVFICYSRRDSEFVNAFVHDLNMAGVNTWYDVNDISRDTASNSQTWRRSVDRALRECTHMIVVLSPNSVGSEEVEAEWNYFLKQKRPLFPIIYQTCDVPYRLDALNWTDFRYDYDSAFNALIKLLPYSATQPLRPPAIKPAESYPPISEKGIARPSNDWLGIPLSTWLVGGFATLSFLVIAIITMNSWPKTAPSDGTPTATSETPTTQPTEATQDIVLPTDPPTSAVTETPTVTLTDEPTPTAVVIAKLVITLEEAVFGYNQPIDGTPAVEVPAGEYVFYERVLEPQEGTTEPIPVIWYRIDHPTEVGLWVWVRSDVIDSLSISVDGIPTTYPPDQAEIDGLPPMTPVITPTP